MTSYTTSYSSDVLHYKLQLFHTELTLAELPTPIPLHSTTQGLYSIFFSSHSIFHRKNVFALVLKIAYSNTRRQAHSQAVVLLVVVLQVRRFLLSSNTSSKANYGLCAETGKTAAVMSNFSGSMKSTELLTAVILGRFAAVFFFNRPYYRTFLKSPYQNTARM